jgi:hypothetical protein
MTGNNTKVETRDLPVRSKPAIRYASEFGNTPQRSLDPSISAGNSNIVLSHFSRKLETRKQGICNTKRLLGKRPNPLEHIASDVG